MDRFGNVMLGALALALAGCGAESSGAVRETAPAEGARDGYAAAPASAGDSTAAADAATPALVGAEAGEGGGAPAAAPPVVAASNGAVSAPRAESPLAAQTPADAAAILRRAERTYEDVRALEADFVQEVTVPLLQSTQRSRGRIYHRRPDRFLMRFSQPAGDMVVADGRHLWMYYPSTDPKQVLRTRVAEGGQAMDLHREFLSNAAERYDAVRTGTEPVAGRPADVLVLRPRTPSSYRQVRIWVDREDALVRRFEIQEENESVRLLELRNLQLNGTLGDELFRFTPPAGAQIFDQ